MALLPFSLDNFFLGDPVGPCHNTYICPCTLPVVWAIVRMSRLVFVLQSLPTSSDQKFHVDLQSVLQVLDDGHDNCGIRCMLDTLNIHKTILLEVLAGASLSLCT